MLDNVNWVLLIGMSGALFSSLRVVKPQIYRVAKSFGFNEDAQKISVLVCALVGGVFMVAIGGERVSIIQGTELDSLYPWMGTIGTGFTIALGSNGVHYVETIAGSINEFIKRLSVKPE